MANDVKIFLCIFLTFIYFFGKLFLSFPHVQFELLAFILFLFERVFFKNILYVLDLLPALWLKILLILSSLSLYLLNGAFWRANILILIKSIF